MSLLSNHNRKVYKLRIFETGYVILVNFGFSDEDEKGGSLKMPRVQKNIFRELDKVKNLVEDKIPSFDIRNLCVTLGRLGTYHYNKKKILLLGVERELYNLLIKNSYNPYTVYRWALLERVPEEIKFQLKNHYLSQKKATKLFLERRHETETSLQQDIRELGLKMIREM